MGIKLELESAKWMEGIVDVHVYTLPCVYKRMFDGIELAKQCNEVGYRAILSKRHHCINADAAYYVRKMVPGFGYYGGIVLNWEVGGLNPSAVDAAIMLGAKEVWMPNRHAGRGNSKIITSDIYTHILPQNLQERPSVLKRRYEPINVLTEEGKLKHVLYEIFDLIKDADIILGTGHISRQEAFTLVKEAKRTGVKKILITHPTTDARALEPNAYGEMDAGLHYWTTEDMKKITELGAILEFNASYMIKEGKSMSDAIKRVGADKCVIASGAGAYTGFHPIEAMRYAIRSMRIDGISEKETNLMTKDKPAFLLGLDKA